MAICLQCEKPAISGSDYCAACEQKAFRKIGGWLWLPAIGLVVGVLANLASFVNTLKTLMESGSLIENELKGMICFELIAFAAFAVAGGYIFSLFIRRKRSLPRYYIVLMIAGLCYTLLDLILASQLLYVDITYQDIRGLIRAAVGACVWIPYFLVSVRVKRTFVR